MIGKPAFLDFSQSAVAINREKDKKNYLSRLQTRTAAGHLDSTTCASIVSIIIVYSINIFPKRKMTARARPVATAIHRSPTQRTGSGSFNRDTGPRLSSASL